MISIVCDCGYQATGRTEPIARNHFVQHKCWKNEVCVDCGQRKSRNQWPRCRPCGYQAARETLLTAHRDLDAAAVERLLAGCPPHRTTRAERATATMVLTALGLSAQQIAQRLKVSERTVVRLRAAW